MKLIKGVIDMVPKGIDFVLENSEETFKASFSLGDRIIFAPGKKVDDIVTLHDITIITDLSNKKLAKRLKKMAKELESE